MSLQSIFYLTLAFLNTLAGLYLLIQWKYVEKEHRSPSILEWGIGFILWSVMIGFVLAKGFIRPNLLNIYFLGAFLTSGFAFSLFLRGILRFFTEKNWFLCLVPLLVFFIYFDIGLIVNFLMPGSPELKSQFFQSFAVAPFSLILAWFFLLAYGRLGAFLSHPLHAGALLAGVSFTLYSIEIGLSFWIYENVGLSFWYIARITTQLLLILGIVMLEKRFHVGHHHKKTAKHIITHLRLENSKPESLNTKSLN